MQWLSHNAIWVLLFGAIFILLLARRTGSGMGAAMGSGMVHDHAKLEKQAANDRVVRDPVNGHPVNDTSAVRLVFDGKTYLFESEQSRAEFQSDPHRFMHGHGAHHRGC
ncbi:YHS domain-containing protein [Paraburkholderia aromaticivorans]|uniref:YHS domain-containing protein n=1 Tax=Paraburkholderia aromaticivorans TaxID=2026199 RepID=UPI0038B932FB